MNSFTDLENALICRIKNYEEAIMQAIKKLENYNVDHVGAQSVLLILRSNLIVYRSLFSDVLDRPEFDVTQKKALCNTTHENIILKLDKGVKGLDPKITPGFNDVTLYWETIDKEDIKKYLKSKDIILLFDHVID